MKNFKFCQPLHFASNISITFWLMLGDFIQFIQLRKVLKAMKRIGNTWAAPLTPKGRS